MPKIKPPKGSPSIDMTPMVDLAFLLVTFFMLSASFRSSEPVDVDVPTSISDIIIPENALIVTIDAKGRVFFNLAGVESRRELIGSMAKKYGFKMNKEQEDKFVYMTTFGCSMSELPAYLNLEANAQKSFPTMGIPCDSTRNELKDWINFGNRSAVNSGITALLEAKSKGLEPNPNDFKPKFILRLDSKALYKDAQKVIDVFRDLNLNNLNFITSMELAPI